MFKWLKEKATQAAANQCKLNIRLNTKTLVSVANRADEDIKTAGVAKGVKSPLDCIAKAKIKVKFTLTTLY